MPRAVQITAFGGPEQLQIVDLPVGEPGPGQIRIRHHACGLNFIDVYQRTGLYANPLPLVLGMEGAGVVEAVGAGVTHLRPGDRAAYAANPPGSYSEARVMPALAVVRLPDDIAFETAAGMMLKGLTAQYLIKRTRPVEGLQPGDHVLFHAAAGGVGLIACQWAKALGLQLIGTAGGAAKCQLALDHGAAHVIDYRSEDFVERVKQITQGPVSYTHLDVYKRQCLKPAKPQWPHRFRKDPRFTSATVLTRGATVPATSTSACRHAWMACSTCRRCCVWASIASPCRASRGRAAWRKSSSRPNKSVRPRPHTFSARAGKVLACPRAVWPVRWTSSPACRRARRMAGM